MSLKINNRIIKYTVIIFCVLSITSILLYKKFAVSIPIASQGGTYFKERLLLDVPLYRQNDPRWAKEKIIGDETIADVGCTLCCVASTFKFYGLSVVPDQLNDYLKRNNGYTTRGWLRWRRCAEYTNDKVTLAYVGNPHYKRIDDNLKLGNPVIVKVYMPNSMAHWVLIIGKDKDQYIINDPLAKDSSLRYLSKYDKIYALRIFRPVKK